MAEYETSRERTERVLDVALAELEQFDGDRKVCVAAYDGLGISVGLTVAELRHALRFCRGRTRNG